MAKQPLILHSREGVAAIQWGRARYRGGRRSPAAGPIVDLLESPEVDSFARTDPSIPDTKDEYSLGRFAKWAFDKLEAYSVDTPFIGLNDLTGLWHAIDWHVRRAWLCIEILADRNCLVLFPAAESRRLLDGTVDHSVSDQERARRLFELARTTRRAHRATSHLIRPGGFVETDLGWMARVETRTARRRVRSTLEVLGVVRRQVQPGQQPRYLPSNRLSNAEAMIHLKAAWRDEIKQIGRVVAGSVPGPRSKRGVAERWDCLWKLPGMPIFVIGTPLSPSAREFLTKQLAPVRRKLILGLAGETRDLGFRKWVFNSVLSAARKEGTTRPVLLIPL
jgi:hypothetical protein